MTAPLPPPSMRLADRDYFSESLVKLAVREALERVEKQLIEADDGAYWYAKELARIPRAMIEKYK